MDFNLVQINIISAKQWHKFIFFAGNEQNGDVWIQGLRVGNNGPRDWVYEDAVFFLYTNWGNVLKKSQGYKWYDENEYNTHFGVLCEIDLNVTPSK